MKTWITGILALALSANLAFADGDVKTDSELDDLLKSIEEQEAELDRQHKEEVKEGLKWEKEVDKPLELIDAQKLIEDILNDMGTAHTEMNKSGSIEVRNIQDQILENVDKAHGDTIREINKLIDIAKMTQVKKGQSESEKKEEGEKKEKGEKPGSSGNNNTAGAPATAPYVPSGSDTADDIERTANDSSKWGDLPDKKRDDMIKAKSAGTPSKYREQIEDYLDKLRKSAKENK